MNDQVTERQTEKLVLQYDLDAEPEKVWRAISLKDYRERWLPQDDLVSAEAVSVKPGQEIRDRMRDLEPPFVESVVTLQVAPNHAGGTSLRIIHETVDRSFDRNMKAANRNGRLLMLAA